MGKKSHKKKNKNLGDVEDKITTTELRKIKENKKKSQKDERIYKESTETRPYPDDSFLNEKDHSKYSDIDDEDYDSDPYGIWENFCNGTTGCPYEDEFISKYGHPSSF